MGGCSRYVPSSPCQCDEFCRYFGNCCPDFGDVCGSALARAERACSVRRRRASSLSHIAKPGPRLRGTAPAQERQRSTNTTSVRTRGTATAFAGMPLSDLSLATCLEHCGDKYGMCEDFCGASHACCSK